MTHQRREKLLPLGIESPHVRAGIFLQHGVAPLILAGVLRFALKDWQPVRSLYLQQMTEDSTEKDAPAGPRLVQAAWRQVSQDNDYALAKIGPVSSFPFVGKTCLDS